VNVIQNLKKDKSPTTRTRSQHSADGYKRHNAIEKNWRS